MCKISSFYNKNLENYNVTSIADTRQIAKKRKSTLKVSFTVKVTGHPFWRFVENRYCAPKISPIFIKFSRNVSQCMQNMIKL
jgi:hypothetical protein